MSLGKRSEAVSSQRIAGENSHNSQKKTFRCSIFFDSLIGIVGTGWRVSACRINGNY